MKNWVAEGIASDINDFNSLGARAEICQIFSLVSWKIFILKLSDLEPINESQRLRLKNVWLTSGEVSGKCQKYHM